MFYVNTFEYNCLRFYDNLRLPTPVEFTRAFLNTYNFQDKKFKDEICQHFNIQIPANDSIAEHFLFEVMNYNYHHIEDEEDKYQVRWKWFIGELNEIIEQNLKQNYLNLKYGKKYCWLLSGQEKSFDIEKFLEKFGLEKNKRILNIIKNEEMKANCKSLVSFVVMVLFLVNLFGLFFH